MHQALHPRYDVDRLDVLRKQGGWGLALIEDSVDASIQLKHYIENHGVVITAIRNNTDNTMSHRITIDTKEKWEEKHIYGCFKRIINNISQEKTWTWLWRVNYKRQTEYLLIAAQNNAMRTNHIKTRIDKTQKIANVVNTEIATKRSITW